jgi:hypothetical protein
MFVHDHNAMAQVDQDARRYLRGDEFGSTHDRGGARLYLIIEDLPRLIRQNFVVVEIKIITRQSGLPKAAQGITDRARFGSIAGCQTCEDPDDRPLLGRVSQLV